MATETQTSTSVKALIDQNINPNGKHQIQAANVSEPMKKVVDYTDQEVKKVDDKVATIGQEVGELSNLQTTAKDKIVNAINELANKSIDAYTKTESDSRYSGKYREYTREANMTGTYFALPLNVKQGDAYILKVELIGDYMNTLGKPATLTSLRICSNSSVSNSQVLSFGTSTNRNIINEFTATVSANQLYIAFNSNYTLNSSDKIKVTICNKNDTLSALLVTLDSAQKELTTNIDYVKSDLNSIGSKSVNLVDETKIVRNDYFGAYNTDYSTLPTIAVKPNTTYSLSSNGVALQFRSIKYYDINNQQISSGSYQSTFTTSDGVYFVQIAIPSKSKVQLEEGSVISPYCKYGITASIEDGSITDAKLSDDISSSIALIPSITEGLTEVKTFTDSYAIKDFEKKSTYLRAIQIKVDLSEPLQVGTTYKIVFKTENYTSTDGLSSFGVIKVYNFSSFSQVEKLTPNPKVNYENVYYYTPDSKVYSFGVLHNSNITASTDKKISIDVYEVVSVKDRVLAIEETFKNGMSGTLINDASISSDKLDFVHLGKNLFDEYADGVVIGGYVTSSGVSSHNDYSTTDYIRVEAGKTYTWSGASIRCGKFYDVNKKEKSSVTDFQSSPYTFTMEYDGFVRFSVAKSAFRGRCILEEGSEATGYEKYKKTIENSLIDVNTLGFAESQKIWMHLPKKIYVAVGRTIELYYNQVVLNAERYHIQVVCSIGYSLERKWQLTGSADKKGSYSMTFNVRDDNNVVIASQSSTIIVTDVAISSPINICCIGDSLTNQKSWVNRIKTLSNSMFVPVGTRRNGNAEGRSGASSGSVYNVLTGKSNLYDFDLFYEGIQKETALDFSTEKSYSIGDVCRVYVKSVGNPAIACYKYYVFVNEHPAGDFKNEDVYCINCGNPFYDWVNKKFSFTHYEQNLLGKSVDAVVIFLGTNGDTPAQLKTFVDNILVDKPNIPIVLVNTIFKGNQNGIGRQGNTDGYSASSGAYKFGGDTHLIELADGLDETFKNYSNVYISPVGFVHDSEYNYGITKVQVNPYISVDTGLFEVQPSDSIHPQEAGYNQIGDEIYSTLCHAIN